MGGVLVGVDRSPASRRAVQLAARVAKEIGEELVVVHVIPWSPYSFTTPTENEHRHRQKAIEVEAATEQIVEPLVALAGEAGIAAERVVRHGDPVDLVIDIAEQRGTDLIVVGRTGDSRLKRAIFGSVPSHLVQAAPVPVTVVP